MSTPQILTWVSQHTGSFPVTGYIGALSASVLALFVLLLLSAVSLGGPGRPCAARAGGPRVSAVL